jgi:hypothetical protein
MDIGNPPFRAPFGARQVHTEDYTCSHACTEVSHVSTFQNINKKKILLMVEVLNVDDCGD